jgi:intraflagellar transport protein 81
MKRNEFREGLIAGRPETVNPILNWLLQRREELKKRAYLSRYLVKIDIAPEMRSDSDVIDLYEQVKDKSWKFCSFLNKNLGAI